MLFEEVELELFLLTQSPICGPSSRPNTPVERLELDALRMNEHGLFVRLDSVRSPAFLHNPESHTEALGHNAPVGVQHVPLMGSADVPLLFKVLVSW